MPECLTLGETMAAFAPDRTGPLRYVPNYSLRIAGAESNTAIGAAKLGVSAAWISRLGADEFGQYIRNQIRAEGVDCSGVHFDPAHRTGVMPLRCRMRQPRNNASSRSCGVMWLAALFSR